MKYAFVTAALTGLVLSLPVTAQTETTGNTHHVAQVKAATPLTEGEVRKVDKDAAKITLRHGPILNLEMPEMTMVFRVQDPMMLDQMKPGDKVRFAADKLGGALTITQIEPAK